jgi:hypothetical protein
VLDKDLKDLLMKMLEKVPGKRISVSEIKVEVGINVGT